MSERSTTIKKSKENGMPEWTVEFSRQAGKQYDKLKRSGSRPSINDTIDVLVLDLQRKGPELPDWPNYRPLVEMKEHYHCHLRKGRPTYVACWRIIDKKAKRIEVY